MTLNSALREYGLSENEIKVYLTLMKMRDENVQNIAKNSGLPRTTTYHLLESLEHKGLVSFVVKESKKYFQVAKPKKLVEMLEEKKKIIQEVIPELTALHGTIKEKPNVKIYEGLKGVRSILKDVLEEKKTIYHYGDIVSMQKVFLHAFPQYIKERIKKKIQIKIICKKEKQHEELLKNAKNELREFVFAPKGFEFKTSVFIYANKVAIFSIKHEPYYVILMENEDFYDTQKNFFDMTWKLSKHSPSS
jgi:HTH-type transcriptional regulator, sugar sensing transcriptional regulator